jgi:dimethylglycine dehydrogenase
VRLRALGLDLVGLTIAGPKARDVLAKVTDADVSKEAFRFMDFREIELGMIPAKVGRVSFTGDLGYEIWVKPEFQQQLFDMLMEAGAEHGIRLFGGRALRSLSLEKGFGSWASEYRPVYGPFEAAMDRFVDLDKNDFIGREAAAKEKAEGPERKLVTLTVEAKDGDVFGDEPIWQNGDIVGWVTSGGYAHHADRSVAMGYVQADKAADGARFEIELLGDRLPATVAAEPLFDPKAARMRG